MEEIIIRDSRVKEKFFVDDAYLNGYAKLCGINATGVYFSLCRHSSKDQICYPSKKLIAQELDIGERSVYSALKVLESWNIISVDEQGRKEDGSFKVKLYTLLDKSIWKPKPQANSADGKEIHPPQANNDISRRHVVPNKEVLREGYTIKEVVATQLTPKEESMRFFSEESNDEKESVITFLVGKGIPEKVARAEMAKFCSYWTERNQTGTKQRWEQEKTFEIKRRLATWFSKVNQFNRSSENKALSKTSFNE